MSRVSLDKMSHVVLDDTHMHVVLA
jgi:hypothetical protein